ncbi:hypothetical protein TNCV_3174861 [Trichonephila clavipes]|nr:hypothetical protein TNCV_3174861 [Trichonephila clavipes]
MDKASRPTSTSIAAYLPKKESDAGIKCIPFDEISVKSHFASLMDFCDFRFIKTNFRKTASKNTERTLENGSRGMEQNLHGSTKKKFTFVKNSS